MNVRRRAPEFAEAYNNRENVRGESGDLDNATGDFEAALRINPEMQESKEGLDRIRRKRDERRGDS